MYVAAMPLLVWLFMRTPLEYVAGVFLVAQAALMLSGGNYSLWQQPQAPIGGLALIVLGLRPHAEYLRISRALESLRGAAGRASRLRQLTTRQPPASRPGRSGHSPGPCTRP